MITNQKSFHIVQLALLVSVAVIRQVYAGSGNIWTDKTCYEYDESIKVTFQIEDPGEDDWIGVYPHAMISGEFEPSMWLWSCGTQGCWGKVNQGILTFGAGGVTVDYLDSWPLDPGKYKAVLSRNGEDDDASYDIYARSEVFEVKRSTGYCGNYPPTDKPTPLPTTYPTTSIPTGSPTTSPSTANPTGSPTAPPTTTPTKTPTATPTIPPTASPTLPPTTYPVTQQPTPTPMPKNDEPVMKNMAPVIAAAKTDIANLIFQERSLAALFLRLIFHDCIRGSCDGCINLSNPDNGMLDFAMDILQPTVDRYESQGLTRPDIWVLASYTGVEMTMPDTDFVAMPFRTIGRQSCNAAHMTQGPNPDVCSSNIDTNDILAFFRAHFNFTPRETAAIMGAHTIGVLHRDVLGFDGMNGWTVDNNKFNNGYYMELVGPGTEQLGQVNRAPNWQQRFVDNSGITTENGDDVPSVFQWEGWPNGHEKIVMLNSDIALVRQLDNGNKAPDGKVTCQFVPRGGGSPCPMARADLFVEMVRYRNDNQAFLVDFRDAMIKMTQVGYDVDPDHCDKDGICRLVKI